VNGELPLSGGIGEVYGGEGTFGTHPSALLATSQLGRANLQLDYRVRTLLVLIHVFIRQCKDGRM
jgi:hypothetical protein